jgi:hypothetical protein
MVKIRTLAPLTHPKTQEQFAAGVEVDVADDIAADWRADGKVSLIADEQAAEKAASEGNYSARMTRPDAPSDAEPPAKKGKS